MKKNSLARLPFPQARPEKGEQGVEGTRGCVSTEAELMVPTWRASASAWGGGTPHLAALPRADPAPEEVRPHLTAACGSGEPRVAHMHTECDFYNHIKQIHNSNCAESNPAASISPYPRAQAEYARHELIPHKLRHAEFHGLIIKQKAIIKGSVRLINVLRIRNVTQEPQPGRQDMNAFKKHINHTPCINSQLVSNDSTWPSATFAASLGTSGSPPSPQQSRLYPAHKQKYHSHASARRDTAISSGLRLCSPGTDTPPPCASARFSSDTCVGIWRFLGQRWCPPGCTARVTRPRTAQGENQAPGEFSSHLCSKRLEIASVSQHLQLSLLSISYFISLQLF